jgi:poly(A) polymerase
MHRLMRETATEIVRRLRSAGFEAFWVGGCVRDHLLGREPKDFDIATNARPEQAEKLFAKTIPVGRQFGVLVVVEDGHEFQIATFRAEADYKDGRRPETVRFSHAREDAIRRDFTVNGLFFDPLTSEVHDWVGGQGDLQARLIRTIGSPEERFAEDHLRLLRAVRFAAQLGFEIEPVTLAAVRQHAASIVRVSPERIREELIKVFAPPHAARGLTLLHESGLMAYVLPELVPTLTCEQSPDYHPEGSVFNHLRLMLECLPNPLPSVSLPWAALLHDIAKPQTMSRGEDGLIHFYGHEKVGAEMAEEILTRLRFPRRQIDEIVLAVRHHMQFKDAPKMRRATLRRMLLRETFPLELELHRLDCLGSHRRLDIYDFLQQEQAHLNDRPHLLPPLLNGRDLMELGVAPGPELGAFLHELRDKQLAEELHTPAEARAWITERLKGAR